MDELNLIATLTDSVYRDSPYMNNRPFGLKSSKPVRGTVIACHVCGGNGTLKKTGDTYTCIACLKGGGK
ncbi:MAG: hypothetical protein ABFC57_06235 [Veillonellales bacterium]